MKEEASDLQHELSELIAKVAKVENELSHKPNRNGNIISTLAATAGVVGLAALFLNSWLQQNFEEIRSNSNQLSALGASFARMEKVPDQVEETLNIVRAMQSQTNDGQQKIDDLTLLVSAQETKIKDAFRGFAQYVNADSEIDNIKAEYGITRVKFDLDSGKVAIVFDNKEAEKPDNFDRARAKLLREFEIRRAAQQKLSDIGSAE